MNRFIQKIIYPDNLKRLSWIERLKMKLVLNISLLAMITVLSIFVLFILGFLPDFEFSSASILTLICGAAVFIFHMTKKFNLAKIITALGYPFIILVCVWHHALPVIVASIFILTLIIGILLYEHSRFYQIVCLVWNSSMGILAFVVLLEKNGGIVQEDVKTNLIFLFGGCVTVGSFIILYYVWQARHFKINNENLVVELEQKVEELERFSYVASHDLKEPLRNIITFSQLVEKSLNEDHEDLAYKYLNVVSSSAVRMNNIIKDTLDYLVSSQDYSSEEIDLYELIQEVVKMQRSSIDEKKIEIVFEKEFPKISSKKVLIHSCLKNLIENAIKYNSNEKPVVNIFYSTDGKYHCVHIKDNGKGIKEKYFSKIFEMYTRLENRDETDGTGIGLALCKKVAEDLNGKIEVKSTLGKGSEFMFYLPIKS